MGYHRDTFYEICCGFLIGDVGALVAKRRALRQPHPDRVSPEL
jgi:hypothetical protein